MAQVTRGMIIFDLDGTLTVPVLDFDAIRAEIGLPPGPILEAVERMDQSERMRALAILETHERAAARDAILQEGAAEALARLRDTGLPIAILTRNARDRAEEVIARFDLRIDALRTRDDGVIKPSPEPIFELCKATGTDPRKSWMIGDHLFDIRSGASAGCTTVLMVGDTEPPGYAAEADHVITRLLQLPALLSCEKT